MPYLGVRPADITSATEAEIAGDLTVDTNTLKVDATNNRVGVGLTAPTSAMHVHVAGSNYSVLQLTNGDTGSTVTDGLHVGMDNNSTVAALNVRDTGAALVFRTQDAERGRFLAGGGLTFNGDTAAANALDDYEEGTWTPAPQFGGNSAGMTFSVGPTGYYTKVGRMVFVWFGFRFSNKGTSVGSFQIRGLPYTIANTSAYTHPTNIAGGVPSANTSMFMALGSGTEIIYRRLDTTIDDAADELDFANNSGWFHSLIYHTS